MKWILISAGVIIILILVVFVVGKLLPVKHRAIVKKEFAVDKLTLWNTIRNFDKYMKWRSTLSKLEVIDKTKWVEFNKRNEKIAFGIIDETSSEKLVTKILGDDLPFGGEWTLEISSSDGHTVLQITENGEVYNPIYRFVGHFFMDETATMKQYMSDLENFFNSQNLKR